MRNFLILSIATILFWLPTASNASKGQINALKNENSKYYSTIEQNEKTIELSADKIKDSENAIEKAKLSLAKYQEAYKAAQEKYDQNSSSANQKLLEMQANRVAIAEKKVSSREERLVQIKEESTKLTANSLSLYALIDKNKTKISKLERAIQEKELQAAVKAAQKPPVEIKAPSTPAVEEPIKETVKLASLTTSAINATPSDSSDENTTPTDSEFNIAFADAIKEIKTYLSGEVSQTPEIHRSTAKTLRGQEIKFSHLGGEIYRGEIELSRNKHTIKFLGSQFRINVSSENHKKTHVIYIDNRSKKRKIIFLEKSQADNIWNS